MLQILPQWLGWSILLGAGLYALVTDLRHRLIYNHLTLPLFGAGLLLSLIQIIRENPLQNFISSPCLWQSWLKIPVITFCLVWLLFSCGAFAGGDAKFILASSPWLSAYVMLDFAWLLCLCFFLWAVFCGIAQAGWSPLRFLYRQGKATAQLIKHGAYGLSGKPSSLEAIPQTKVAGMPAIFAALCLTYHLYGGM